MFKRIGSFVTRYPWAFIGGWLAVLIALHFAAPCWDQLVSEGELEHLPKDSPTRVANRIYDQAFPNERAESNIVICLRRTNRELGTDDFLFMARDLVPALLRDADQFGGVIKPSILRAIEDSLIRDGEVTEEELEIMAANQPAETDAANYEGPRFVSVTAPHNSVMGPLLISDDQQAMLIVVDLTSSFLTSENEPLIEEIESTLATLRESPEKPDGLEMYITGSAILGRDVVAAVTKSTNAVQNWTIWLVLILLFVVFRAPGAALFPLVTLFVAVKISLDFMAALAAGGILELYDGLQIYATVLIYGAGVDYSMFLISRFREELGHGEAIRTGLITAVAKVGFAIVISAGTEVVGLGTLGFAEFGKFSQAGVSIPIGLAITLIASLTLTVALLQVSKKGAFWPLTLSRAGSERDAPTKGKDAEEYDPGFTYRFWERIGRYVTARPASFLIVSLVLTIPFCIVAVRNDDNLTYDLTSGLPKESPSLAGNQVLQEHFSKGIIGPITVLLYDKELNFSSPEGIRELRKVSDKLLSENKDFHVSDLRVLIHPAGTSPRAKRLVDLLRTSIPERWEKIKDAMAIEVDEELDQERLPAELQELIIDEAKQYYVSHAEPYANRLTRLTIVLDRDPFSRESIDHVDSIGKVIESATKDDSTLTFQVMGPTAGLSDVRATAERDRGFMRLYVTAAIFLILVVLLRRFFVSLWLVLSVILTYLTTMGVAHLVFRAIGGSDFAGLQWTVPVLLFTLLMAVGADYNVLLIQRYQEEKHHHGATRGVVRALAATGGLISGAGIVMAGTFLALNLGGTMSGMHQLGFALAFGVLLDTFLIRPLLVPSFVLLLERLSRRLLRPMKRKLASRFPYLNKSTRNAAG